MKFLYIEPNSINQSRNGSITGIIFFDFGDYQFPEVNWNDFPVIILGWWLSELRKLITQHSEYIKIDFMDGPHFLIVRQISKTECLVECFDNVIDPNPKYSKEILLKTFLGNILKKAKEVLDICFYNAWETDDINNLNLIYLDMEG